MLSILYTLPFSKSKNYKAIDPTDYLSPEKAKTKPPKKQNE